MENLEELRTTIDKVTEVVNHLNEEQQILVLLDVASKIGTNEWQSDILDLMRRMKLL